MVNIHIKNKELIEEEEEDIDIDEEDETYNTIVYLSGERELIFDDEKRKMYNALEQSIKSNARTVKIGDCLLIVNKIEGIDRS
jgi:hypothetical protein